MNSFPLSRFFMRKNESIEPSCSAECDALLCRHDDLSLALFEKGSISLSDLDLPNTIGDGCECDGADEGWLFFITFSWLKSTFTPLEADSTAFGGGGRGRSALTGETLSFSLFLEIVRAIFVLATRSMSLLLARPMPCRRRFRRSLISPGSDIHMS